jgi:hypothetical protein
MKCLAAALCTWSKISFFSSTCASLELAKLVERNAKRIAITCICIVLTLTQLNIKATSRERLQALHYGANQPQLEAAMPCRYGSKKGGANQKKLKKFNKIIRL